jgi:DNA-binding CsgD family transcriptional regulator
MRFLCTAVVESLNCLYRASDRQSFIERVVAAADSFFPGCVIAWHDIDGRSGATDRHHANIAPLDMGKIWSRVALDSPVVRYYLNGGRDSLTFTRDIISMRDFRKTRAYQESWKPVGAVDQMCVNFTAPGRVFGLSIKRDRRFYEEDRRLIRAFAPHVIRCCERAYDREYSVEDVLTRRELEILGWIRKGKRDSEIGCILGISSLTVAKHVEHIREKLGVETRGAAAEWAR